MIFLSIYKGITNLGRESVRDKFHSNHSDEVAASYSQLKQPGKGEDDFHTNE